MEAEQSVASETDSRLAAVAENRDPGIDSVGPRETGPTVAAGLALPSVDQELQLEVACLSGAGPIISEGGPIGLDCGVKDPADLGVEPPVIIGTQAVRGLGGIDAGRE
jgi:hypothetical protein